MAVAKRAIPVSAPTLNGREARWREIRGPPPGSRARGPAGPVRAGPGPRHFVREALTFTPKDLHEEACRASFDVVGARAVYLHVRMTSPSRRSPWVTSASVQRRGCLGDPDPSQATHRRRPLGVDRGTGLHHAAVLLRLLAARHRLVPARRQPGRATTRAVPTTHVAGSANGPTSPCGDRDPRARWHGCRGDERAHAGSGGPRPRRGTVEGKMTLWVKFERPILGRIWARLWSLLTKPVIRLG